jgi:D-3-phosphoglycerate dehydrogenase
MSKYRIIVCDHINQKGLDILSTQDDVDYINLAHLDKDTLLKELSTADVVITRSSTDVDEKFLEYAKNLKAIVRAGVGVDNVNIDACSKNGIIVMNVPTANTIAAVELTMTHILSCMRKFPYSHEQLKNQRIWKREDWYGRELKDKKLGIIGFGNIGSRVGLRAKAFEMDVVTYDPYIPASKATDLGVKYTKNFDDILDCDIITIHTPKNSETINMLDSKEMEKIKDGAVLINCARGGLYNEDALYDALKSKKISMAGIDVFNKEPANNHKLLDLDNIVVSAHLGANTVESQEKIATQAAENAISAARGISYPNALNLPIKENEIPDFVKPYLELTQKIAFLAAQTNKSPIKSIKVTSKGEISQYLESLKTFATVGALKESMGENINYVNALFVANERNVDIETQELANNTAYKNKISVKITTENGDITITGTVFEESVQKILDINGFDIDIEPKGKMILYRNSDVPGVIGEVGTLLANHNINISDFRLGRNSSKEALAVILVDDNISSEIIDKLSNLKASLQVSYAVL